MSTIITDSNGIPVPQYLYQGTGVFQTMQGENGAIFTIDRNAPVDGVNKVRLIGKDNKEVPISESGVPVILSDNSSNCMFYNGTRWVEANHSCNMLILTKASYTTGTKSSNKIYNNGCKDAILTLNMDTSTTNSISRIDIVIVDAAGNSVPYKSITPDVPITTGPVVITFGTNDATSKFVVPSEFMINFIHTSNAIALSYGANLQLV